MDHPDTSPIVDWVSDRLRPIAASLVALQLDILQTTVAKLAADEDFELAEPARDGAGDVSFKLDIPAEEMIDWHFASETHLWPMTIVAEGLGERTYGSASGEHPWRVILDPVDGTRELAVAKRSAWSLAGVAPDRGRETSLRDLVLSVQTELPPPKQRLASLLVAERGRGVTEVLWDCAEHRFVTTPHGVRASRIGSIRGGFASIVHFFPGLHRAIGEASERLFLDVLGPPAPNEAQVFDDQYCSTGGQLYLLATGRYRFVADLRGIVPGITRGLTAHPYDLSTYLIAVEAGATITDPYGAGLDYPLDTSTACSWVGFANGSIAGEVTPALRKEVARLETSSVAAVAAPGGE